MAYDQNHEENHGDRDSRIRDYLTALRNATTLTSTNFGFAVRTTRSIIISKNTCVTALAIISDGV